MDSLDIIGRAEKIDLVDLGLQSVPAKVDTGADSSSIWVSSVTEKTDGLHCVFFGPGSEFYTGDIITIQKDYSITRVANSFGHKELRYKIKLRVRVGGRLVRATFTLADRSVKTYPILLGRRLLTGKFLVDVSIGTTLAEVEREKRARLKHDMASLKTSQDGMV
jgi:hypothetical protein